MTEGARRKDVGFLVIGAMKLASAVGLFAAGCGIFRMIDKDIGGALEHFVERLHLDPDNRLIHAVIERVGVIDSRHLKVIGAGTFLYAFLHTLEGTGLLLRRRWAGYLTVVITGLLLPLEVYEVARKATAVRIAVLLVNLGIMAYVVVKLWQERRDSPS